MQKEPSDKPKESLVIPAPLREHGWHGETAVAQNSMLSLGRVSYKGVEAVEVSSCVSNCHATAIIGTFAYCRAMT